MPNRLINAVMFNATWLGVVLSQSSIIAPAVVSAHLALHFFLMGNGGKELKFIVFFTLFGVGVDQALFRTGVFTVAGDLSSPPVWMACLWPALGTTFTHAFAGLRKHLALSAVIGGVGGVASYVAGTRLTDVAFASDFYGILILGTLWAIIFPVALVISNQAAID